MPWKPLDDHDFPTLGYDVVDWIEANLSAPGVSEYAPYLLYPESIDFIARLYELDPLTGKRKYHRAVLGRPRGWGKSPLMSAVAAAESLADVVFDGWDANGQPVGRPWHETRSFKIQVAAVSEAQTMNAWSPLLEMLRLGPALDDYDIEPFDGQVNVPGGIITPVTASPRSIKGAPNVVLAILDQTEEWVQSNGGIKLANVMRANAAKTGGFTIETPNAYIPGENSVAEGSANFWKAIREDRSKDDGLWYDHREAPGTTDVSDRESLLEGLRVSYGDASAHPDGCAIHSPACPPGHVDLDRLVSTIWDPEQDVQQSRSDFLNQVTHASDSWISGPEWDAVKAEDTVIEEGDTIVLGFDGSRGRQRGNADATALIGCRVSDGHLFTVRVWEQPDGEKDWTPPLIEVDAEIRDAFENFRVVAFYADPSGWTSQIAAWEAKYGKKLKIKASQQHPVTMWPRGQKDSKVEVYTENFRVTVINEGLSHDGSSALTRHILNARRRSTRTGYRLYKAYPDSPLKIDAAYAAVMAWQARTDAVAKGIGTKKMRRARYHNLT